MNECKGLFFHSQVSMTFDAEGVFKSTYTMSLLKDESCPGCKDCVPILKKDLLERLGLGIVPAIQDLENNARYQLGYIYTEYYGSPLEIADISESKDFLDEMDLGFVKVEE